MLAVDEMKKYIDLCVDCYKSLRLLVLTGGEVFIYGYRLAELIQHASSKGLLTRVVSNAYWAKDYNSAFNKIKKLKEAGLNEINVSTGDDHLEFVPLTNIMNATLASLKQDLTVVINVESAKDRKFDSKLLLNNPDFKDYIHNGKLQILNGIWMPINQSKVKTIINDQCANNSNKYIGIGV
ncbi:hypothetical protein FACS1894195_3990 [Bacteroidia bacterium]|nr:hypothetical protein FACS1894195_3990 [Bacteroidia bacterium]